MGTHRRYAPQKGNFSLAVKIVKVILNLHFDIWKTFKKHFELEFLECTNHEHSFWASKLPFFLVVYHKLQYDDEGVEKDQGLPGMFSVHLVEKIWILVNFIKREDSFDIRPGHFYW